MEFDMTPQNVKIPDRAVGLIEAELEAAASKTSVSVRLLMGYGFGVLFIVASVIFLIFVVSGANFRQNPLFESIFGLVGSSIGLGVGIGNYNYTRRYARALEARGLHPWHNGVS